MAVSGVSETRGAAARSPRGNTYTYSDEYTRDVVLPPFQIVDRLIFLILSLTTCFIQKFV